jgi:hypothetical protein
MSDRPDTGSAASHLDGDAALVRGEEPPSSRTPLSQERVVDAAVEFEESLENLLQRIALIGSER